MRNDLHPRFVLVADGERVLLLESGDPSHPGRLDVRERLGQPHAATREQGSHRPGRRGDAARSVAGTSPRGAIEQTDGHQRDEDRFAAHLAQELERWDRRAPLKRLLIVAPPRTLSVLRQRIRGAVAGRIVGEMPRELARAPLEQIAEAVAGFMASAGGN